MNPLIRQIAQAVNRHPRRIMAGLGALLLGTAVTAFGIAPIAPDAADLPTQQLVESVQPALLAPQGSLEPTTPFVLFRSEVTRRNDTLQSLLQRLGVDDRDAMAHLRADPLARELFTGRHGKLVTAETSDRHRLLRLQARWLTGDTDRYDRLVIEQTPDGYASRIEQGELTSSIRLGSGTIRTSLFAATDEARLPDSIASQLAEVFSAEIDFRRDLRVDDRFSVVYETLEADGEVLRHGRLLSAEFQNNGTTHQVVWFQEPGQKGGYYDYTGQSLKRVFLASPLAFSRVSSGYGMRFHPISGNRRPHLGIDYAAPTGTPVRTVGDGVVQFAGRQGGYGNVVYVQHRQQKVTVYAHLSRIHVRKGQRVDQGDLIGAVGSTGASTGPHLHFEFREAGRHIDPLTIARQNEGVPVSASARPAFNQHAQAMRRKLEFATTLVQASAD